MLSARVFNRGAVRQAARAFNTAAPATDRVIVFDTTLRDGEQSPGATLFVNEKIEIAKLLSKLRVDVCEAGFPIASQGDFEAVTAIAHEVGSLTDGREGIGPMRICGLSRSVEKDIHRCWDAVRHAPAHRIHTFLATSDIHLEYKLKISREECVKRSVAAVEYAKSLVDGSGGDVEFSAEDAGRSDPEFLAEVYTAVVAAGASTLNVPDTVGYVTPTEYGKLIGYLIENVPKVTPAGEPVIFSTHCHNDLGLATANTLEAVQYGARQIEVTINGIGERAGNTSLEETVMAIMTRPNSFPVHTVIDARQITKASRMVSSFTGMAVQPNKAIVGANAFAHEAGIHQDGVLKHSQTYEIMTPESVGLADGNNLVLGKHSGKAAYRNRLEQLGYKDLSADQVDAFVSMFKALADEKKEVTDADIEAIMNAEAYQDDVPTWTLNSVHVTAGNRVAPTATVSMEHKDGETITTSDVGTGPVDAIYNAIGRATKENAKLAAFAITAVSGEHDALGEVQVRISPDLSAEGFMDAGDSPEFAGKAANIDILVAAAHAYVNALNKLSKTSDFDEIRDSKTLKLEGAAGV